MIYFNNLTDLDLKRLLAPSENIFLHTGMLQSERGVRIDYINKASEIIQPGIYILRDLSLENGLIKSMERREKYFIPNPVSMNDFINCKDSLFLEKNGAFVLKFDLIALMAAEMYNKVKFDSKRNYEDYLAYQRFPFMEHILGKFKEDLKKIILSSGKAFLEEDRKENAFFLPTFDFDRIRYFSVLKDILYKIPLGGPLKRRRITYNESRRLNKHDPWERGREIAEISKARNIDGVFFAFVSSKDKFARRYKLKEALNIKKTIPENSSFGVHISYESATDFKRAKCEIERFKKISKEPLYSRFHYLFPINEKTSAMLSSENIRADFSAGMRGRIGFLNGFCKPYRLAYESTMEIPVSAMDSALVIEKKKENYPLKNIADEVSLLGGVFSIIFHPSSLDKNTFPEYESVLETMLSAGEKMKNTTVENILNHMTAKPEFFIEGEILTVDKSSKKNIKVYRGTKDFIVKSGEKANLKEEK
ncbi:MAG: hypothetical protein PHW02_00625 [bacterium]|nr:hypothetical protein [bacterium]